MHNPMSIGVWASGFLSILKVKKIYAPYYKDATYKQFYNYNGSPSDKQPTWFKDHSCNRGVGHLYMDVGYPYDNHRKALLYSHEHWCNDY